jgi:hypothetical protein
LVSAIIRKRAPGEVSIGATTLATKTFIAPLAKRRGIIRAFDLSSLFDLAMADNHLDRSNSREFALKMQFHVRVLPECLAAT